MSRAKLTRNVAPGIHLLSHAFVNCYLVEGESGVLLVDAALPRTWPYLAQALRAIDRDEEDLRAVALTHAHFDHLGFAQLLQTHGVPIYGHVADAAIAAHPYSYAHENPRLLYPLRHPRGLRPLGAMTAAGALNVPGVRGLLPLTAESAALLPGHPQLVFCPGHTDGHCALYFPDRSALLVGDALVTFDPYTGARGPQIVAGAATANSDLALHSLDALADTGARIVLPGHGAPWKHGIESAVVRARAAGAS